MASWFTMGGLDIRIEAKPDTISLPSGSNQPEGGKVEVEKRNHARTRQFLEFKKISSSDDTVAVVNKKSLRRIKIPGRPSKWTSAPSTPRPDKIADWQPGTNAGTATLTAEFRLINSSLHPVGYMLPVCDIKVT